MNVYRIECVVNANRKNGMKLVVVVCVVYELMELACI